MGWPSELSVWADRLQEICRTEKEVSLRLLHFWNEKCCPWSPFLKDLMTVWSGGAPALMGLWGEWDTAVHWTDTTVDTAGLSFLGERDDARQSPVTAEHPWLHLSLSPFTLDCSLAAKSCLTLLQPPWTIAQQAPLSVGFPRSEYQSGLPFPSPGDLPDPGT